MTELYLGWRGWSVPWTTRWSWILTSAAAVALNKPSWQRHAWSVEIEGHNIIHTGEWSSALFAPSPLLSPSACDNHTKCNLQHYLHLFTFTNYILLKLPRKICQKNVITQNWNMASSEISSLPFWKKHYGVVWSWALQVTAGNQVKSLRYCQRPAWGSVCAGGLPRGIQAVWSSRLFRIWASEPCQAASGGGAVWWLVAKAGWNVLSGSGLCSVVLWLLLAAGGGVSCPGSMTRIGELALAESLLCSGISGKRGEGGVSESVGAASLLAPHF